MPITRDEWLFLSRLQIVPLPAALSGPLLSPPFSIFTFSTAEINGCVATILPASPGFFLARSSAFQHPVGQAFWAGAPDMPGCVCLCVCKRVEALCKEFGEGEINSAPGRPPALLNCKGKRAGASWRGHRNMAEQNSPAENLEGRWWASHARPSWPGRGRGLSPHPMPLTGSQNALVKD